MRKFTFWALCALALLPGIAAAQLAGNVQAAANNTLVSGIAPYAWNQACNSGAGCVQEVTTANPQPTLWEYLGTDSAYHPCTLALCVSAGGGGGGGANAAAGTTGSAPPGSASYEGFSSAGNLVGVSSANPFPVSAAQNGTWNVGVTGTVPVSGTFWQATQPVSGAVAATQSGAWNIGSITTLPALPTGANTIGNVGVVGTVPVSGTFWQTTQPVSGTVTLTAPAAGAWSGSDGYAQASTSSGQYGPLIQATVANPAYTNGQTSPLAMTTYGALRSDFVNSSGTNAISANNSSVAVGSNLAAGCVYNNTASSPTNGNQPAMQCDSQASLHVAATPSTDPLDGLGPTAVATSSSLLKSTAGNLYEMRMTQGSTTGFLVEYNATSVPGGALTASLTMDCIPLAPNAQIDVTRPIPDYLSAGIVIMDSASCTTAATLVTPVLLVGKFK